MADTLMAMSGALGVAITSAILVSPIGFIIATIASGSNPDFLLGFARIDSWLWGLLIIVFLGAVAVVMLGRRAAFKIYDDIYPD
ncbi:hypothetical protein GXB84_05700 [Stenotrophomonas acidaminiphila]|uniref:hypothetical protein n=1 Tax=Stenotrophomonas acidaminiphila TaxID=128780 RepID=UPI00137592C1|nr:hypothetical protein [Stenotrophomonas acidaminiphila]NCT86824.1 hypothetical protein [Stenotrophomonas acidaminiphila]